MHVISIQIHQIYLTQRNTIKITFVVVHRPYDLCDKKQSLKKHLHKIHKSYLKLTINYSLSKSTEIYTSKSLATCSLTNAQKKEENSKDKPKQKEKHNDLTKRMTKHLCLCLHLTLFQFPSKKSYPPSWKVYNPAQRLTFTHIKGGIS